MPYDTKEKKAEYDARRWAGRVKLRPLPANTPVGIAHDSGIKVPKNGLRIAVIPDVQAMAGVPMDHLTAAGNYIAAKQPDVIVCIGDFGDFPSLSRFERGTMAFEGRRYKSDLGAFHRAMTMLLNPISKVKGYRPHMHFTMGNHEDHIPRYVQENPALEGFMSLDDLELEGYGWTVHDFLQPVSIGGVAFCHYFPSGVKGLAIGTARALLTKLHMSAFAGHLQGRDIAFSRRADGAHMTAIISGSFYQHEYDYLSPFTNAHWRGMWFLNEVRDGMFDEMPLTIDFLRRKYR